MHWVVFRKHLMIVFIVAAAALPSGEYEGEITLGNARMAVRMDMFVSPAALSGHGSCAMGKFEFEASVAHKTDVIAVFEMALCFTGYSPPYVLRWASCDVSALSGHSEAF